MFENETNYDLNTLTEFGIYSTGSLDSLSNLPQFSGNHKRGIIIVFGYTIGKEEKRIIQIIITTGAQIATRFYSGSWENWVINS